MSTMGLSPVRFCEQSPLWGGEKHQSSLAGHVDRVAIRDEAVQAMKRVLIVDDHPVFRDGLAALVDRQDGMTVVAQAESQTSAMRSLRSHGVDFAIVDVTLSSGGGLSLVRSIRAEWPGLPVLVLSMHDEKSYAERAFRAGAQGYVMKDQPWADLLDAIRRVVAGHFSFSVSVTKRLLGTSQSGAGTSSLSDRELEVFSLLGQGLRIREVGTRLKISPKTVESHVATIKRKLDIRHANELIHRATLWLDSAQRGASRVDSADGEELDDSEVA